MPKEDMLNKAAGRIKTTLVDSVCLISSTIDFTSARYDGAEHVLCMGVKIRVICVDFVKTADLKPTFSYVMYSSGFRVVATCLHVLHLAVCWNSNHRPWRTLPSHVDWSWWRCVQIGFGQSEHSRPKTAGVRI